VQHGESLGLIGPNGAGKSTLLNLATGLSLPDSGSIRVAGRVAALLELGAGFHGDLTGAENLWINAALSGLSRRQTSERFEEIVDFSGVREFIHEPLRTYSAGMVLRLAFSVAIHTDPDVLLIDEVIGVGDQEFHAKCLDKIRALQGAGKTILLASHSLALLTMLCRRALWLDHGRVMEIGPAADVVAAYQSGRVSTA
jgi:ABC-type polysaccharide/polyol phosphate transport system ATPase subunit